MTADLALAAVLLEAQRRDTQAHDEDALERLRRLASGDDVHALDVRDTYADADRVRRAVGIAIAALRLEPSPGQVLDARREAVVQLATEQLRREVVRTLNRLGAL